MILFYKKVIKLVFLYNINHDINLLYRNNNMILIITYIEIYNDSMRKVIIEKTIYFILFNLLKYIST